MKRRLAVAVLTALMITQPVHAQESSALTITGTISPGLDYQVDTSYAASATSGDCMAYSDITGTMIARERSVRQALLRQGLSHRVSIPAQIADGEPCGWRASTVWLCMKEKCQVLLIVRDDAPPLVTPIELLCTSACFARDGAKKLPLLVPPRGTITLNLNGGAGS